MTTVTATGGPIDVWSAVDTWKRCQFIDVSWTREHMCRERTLLRFPSPVFLTTGTRHPSACHPLVGETNLTSLSLSVLQVPDIPARAFRVPAEAAGGGALGGGGIDRMIVGSTNYHHMSGSSILDQQRECATAYNKTGDPNPAMFAANEFLDSPFSFGNGTVVSLVHTEYPGNVYNNTGPDPPMCPGKAYPTCWTVTIGLSISHDWGLTWSHARPPPHHMVAAVPYGYNSTQLAYGWVSCVCVCVCVCVCGK